MHAGYELFDHTADVGVRARADSLPELLQVAVQGLYAVIGELLAEGEARVEQFEFTGSDPALLMRDFLAELLGIFERDLRVLTTLQVEEFTAGRLVARGESHSLDREHSELDREAKAVTYHGLKIRPVEGGYKAEFIVDI